jgi:hypothetical protein
MVGLIPRRTPGDILRELQDNQLQTNDGLHLVTAYYVLSEETTKQEKYNWLAKSYVLLAVQLVVASAILVGSVAPNCTANSHCRDGQYCCPR